MSKITSQKNSVLRFRSKRTGEIITKTVSVTETTLLSNLPTDTDLIKIDPAVQNAKDLGLVKE